jgi:hypothetical protein
MQDEQVQPIGSELVNAPNMDATHKVATNEQDQTIAESIMQKDPQPFTK